MDAPAGETAAAFRVADALHEASIALFSMFIFAYFGVTILLYGLAVSLSDVYPKWLGWTAVVLGVGAAVLGLIQAYQGLSETVSTILFPIVATLISLWILVMGVLLWRKTGAAA